MFFQPPPYTTPYQNEQRVRMRAQNSLPEGGAAYGQHAVNNAAERYARMRMQQMQRLYGMLGNSQEAVNFRSAFDNTQGLDPAQAWRFISQAFSQLANARGYQDPRLYLQQMFQNH